MAAFEVLIDDFFYFFLRVLNSLMNKPYVRSCERRRSRRRRRKIFTPRSLDDIEAELDRRSREAPDNPNSPELPGFEGHVGRFVAFKEDATCPVYTGVVACKERGDVAEGAAAWQVQLGWTNFASFEDCNAQKHAARRYTRPFDLEAWERRGRLVFLDCHGPGYNPLYLHRPVRRVLVLCSGTGHDARSYARLYPGVRVDTVDVRRGRAHAPTFLADVLRWRFRDAAKAAGGEYDVVHASPPCTAFSRANHRPTLEAELEGARVAMRCFEIIARLRPKVWILENPANRLPSHPFMEQWERYRRPTSYCRFGTLYRKPTNVWTNVEVDLPRCTAETPCAHYAESRRHPRTSQRGARARADGTRVEGTAPEQAQQMPIALLRRVLAAAPTLAPPMGKQYARGPPAPPGTDLDEEADLEEDLEDPEEEEEDLEEARAAYWDAFSCEVCGRADDEGCMLVCDGCQLGFHVGCVRRAGTGGEGGGLGGAADGVGEGRDVIPPGDWYCATCL